MNKEKVAFFIESMIVGGAEKVLIDFANSLNTDVYDVTVIALFKKSVYSNYVFQFEEGFNSNVKYKFLINNTNKLWYLIFNFIYSKMNVSFVYRWLIKEKYDIEVAFYEGWPTEFVAKSTQSSLKIAWLHTDQERLFRNVSEQRKNDLYLIYKNYHQIIGVSYSVCKSFSRIFPKFNAHIVYNPFNLELIQYKSEQKIDYEPKKNIINFLTVGRLIEVKGYGRLIKALALCKDEGYNFSLTMIGEGEYREQLQELINSLNLNQMVKILGHIENPYPYMKKVDCLICSSFAEGFGNVIVESLAVETPVLTTDCGGPTEIIMNSQSGIVCENSDAGLLFGLKEIFNNTDLLVILKKNTKKTASLFSIEQSVKAVEVIFEKNKI